MSIFGSREEDPLLQDDLFNPTSTTEDSCKTGEESATDSQTGTERDPSDGRTDDTRRITCFREEAAEGRLDRLNRALNSDWELTRIQLEDDNERFAFVLRCTHQSSGTESIV